MATNFNGKIIEIKDKIVKINLGEKAVKKKDRGIIYTVKEVFSTATILPLAEIKIDLVFPNFSVGKIEKLLENVSLKENLPVIILKTSPEDFFSMIACNEKGISFYKKKQWNFAIKEYRRAIEKFPIMAVLYNNLGVALIKKSRLKEAIWNLKKALRINPEYAGAHINLGKAYEKIEKLDMALESWQEALRISPEEASPHYKTLPALPRKIKKEYPPKNGEKEEKNEHIKKALELFAEGRKYFEEGNLEKAIESWQKAVELNPEFSEGHLNLGTAFKERERPEDALYHYNKAIELNPNDFLAYYNLGLVYYQEEKFGAASEKYRKALEINPSDKDCRYNLAMALFYEKKYREAEKELSEVLKTDGSYGPAYYSLGLVYDEMERLNSAVTNYQKAIRLMPLHAPSHY